MGNNVILFYVFNGICSIKINGIVQIYQIIFVYHNSSAHNLLRDFSVV